MSSMTMRSARRMRVTTLATGALAFVGAAAEDARSEPDHEPSHELPGDNIQRACEIPWARSIRQTL